MLTLERGRSFWNIAHHGMGQEHFATKWKIEQYILKLGLPYAVICRKTIELAGDTRMYYQKAGSGNVPIVLVHVFGASSFS